MQKFEDLYIQANDIRHHLRKWSSGNATQPPILCLPGLTRNVLDFDDIGPLLADNTARDVYAMSFRGRGQSDYAQDYLTYTPMHYAADVLAVLDDLALPRVAILGTSLGGIVGMVLGATVPDRLTRLVLNDIGPELAEAGLARIAGYAGLDQAHANWDVAAAMSRQVNEVAFPDASPEFWGKFARRTYVQAEAGLVTAYDKNIAKAFVEAGPAPDLWPLFTLLSCPILTLHGALSDLLTPEIVDKMIAAKPEMLTIDVANVGHAPSLEEPAAQHALKSFFSAAA
ncbi:MAG: alpha/beta hydrolase [Parvularculaceae bacterium]